jgi:hypothetical protein
MLLYAKEALGHIAFNLKSIVEWELATVCLVK